MSAVSSSFPRVPDALARPARQDTTELTSAELLDRLLKAHRRESESAGYQRALNDVVGTLVWITEQFIRQHPEENLRKPLYAFVEYLESHVKNLPHSQGYVEGGLGI